jgi:hypothetical protein
MQFRIGPSLRVRYCVESSRSSSGIATLRVGSRFAAHDFGIRADTVVMAVCYGMAAMATLVTIFALFRV